jgi:hypothetical protein
MNSSRSIPFTITLLPLGLASLFFSFAGWMTLLVLFGNLFGAGKTIDFKLLATGIGAMPLLASCIGAFKMKRWGLYGLGAFSVLFLLMVPFVGTSMLSLVGLTALPLLVAFALKDFDNME